jgi:hypothetical protein
VEWFDANVERVAGIKQVFVHHEHGYAGRANRVALLLGGSVAGSYRAADTDDARTTNRGSGICSLCTGSDRLLRVDFCSHGKRLLFL